MRLTLAQLLIDSFPTASKLSGQYSWRRFVGDFPKLLLLQFLFGLVPELIFPTFGLSGLLPKLMGTGSYLIVCWVRHNAPPLASTTPASLGGALERPAYSHSPQTNASCCRMFP